MSITVNFWSFTKKVNSTKQPTGTAGLSASCLLKDATSIITPVIELKATDSPIGYNYAQISAFNRYYFVDDITWNAGVWEVSLHCDVLASYKSTIGSTNGYVLRAANYSDGNILDELYPATTDVDTEIAYSTLTSTNGVAFTGWSNGSYILGVQGIGTGSVNGIIYYSIGASDLVTILQRFYANINDAGWWGSTVSGVKNALTNADDYITSLRWYPCYIPISVSLNRIKLGSFDTGVDAYILTGDPQVVTREVSIMRHPQAATRGAYLNYAPYSRYEIVDPLVGVIPVSSDIAKVINTIKNVITVDYTTGQARYDLATAGGVVFYTTYINFAVTINLSAHEVDLGKVAGSIGTAIGGYVRGGATGFLGMTRGIANAIDAGIGTPSGNQSSGGFVQYGDGTFMLRGYFKPIVDEDKTNKGRPYCKWNNPATVRDYMVIDNPHVATSGTAAENDQINAYLAEGFYYE